MGLHHSDLDLPRLMPLMTEEEYRPMCKLARRFLARTDNQDLLEILGLETS